MPMDSTAAITGTFLAGVAGIAFSIPMLFNKVPRNPLYGFRTRLTLSSDEVWYPANRFAAKAMIAWGLLNLLAGFIALQFHPLPPTGQYLLMVPMLSVLIVVIICLLWVRKNYGHLAP